MSSPAARLAKLPRVSLAHLPTTLEEMRRLSAHFGGPRLFVKGDDCTELGLECHLGIMHGRVPGTEPGTT